eukprot:CAMPEP_0119007258 /NCGR_PEP_ID=MMETSP1176-20130426/2892_1 /TAXON_ID=265551 /ORGANISM="Synedropsis recta cf, Strain CCMP1620" /LENGTH=468 /DNA_ID=CAMNT_0006959373 /DNA_START=160 /DNA_END=1566 /DNA_ORIENTATION=-
MSSSSSSNNVTSRSSISKSSSSSSSSSISAYLCDSRSCNQMGGGEHFKADMEDLLQLAPPHGNSNNNKVTLTTCYGLCNRSPNMKLKSRGGNHLRQQKARGSGRRLRNDGGLRMRVDDDDGDDTNINGRRLLNNETNDEQQQHVEHVDRMIISEITIAKVACAIGVTNPFAVHAMECKSYGNKCFRDGHYKDALQHYMQGRRQRHRRADNALLVGNKQQQQQQDNADADLSSSSMSNLQASLWLCCAKTRVQWALSALLAADGNDNDEATNNERIQVAARDLLQEAAVDAFQVLKAAVTSTTADSSSARHDHEIDAAESSRTVDDIDTIYTVTEKLVHNCAAGLETQALILEAATARKQPDDDDAIISVSVVPVTNDLSLLTQLCITLADAWNGLATINTTVSSTSATNKQGTTAVLFADGARVAYTSVLRVVAASDEPSSSAKTRRLLRAKERRRIVKAIEALSPPN